MEITRQALKDANMDSQVRHTLATQCHSGFKTNLRCVDVLTSTPATIKLIYLQAWRPGCSQQQKPQKASNRGQACTALWPLHLVSPEFGLRRCVANA